ncbi:hypothetical protein LCGC14_1873280, partial [marine sediment metagenome]
MTRDSHKFIVSSKKALSINSVFHQTLRAVKNIALLKDTVGEEGQIGSWSKEEVLIIMRESNIQSIHEKPSRGSCGVYPFKFCTKLLCLVA